MYLLFKKSVKKLANLLTFKFLGTIFIADYNMIKYILIGLIYHNYILM